MRTFSERSRGRAGSVLIIVLWVAFGLVSLTLYFAHANSLELRAADNRVAGMEAEQAIAGMVRYVTNVLGKLAEPGSMPLDTSYRYEALDIGSATVWLIGRDPFQNSRSASDRPFFGLGDEAGKLNLNTATQEMLEQLPGMTAELAAAIVDWRDEDEEVTQGGAETQSYQQRNPSYKCKNAKFESVDELRLVLGADLDILYGEDTNLNGAMDPNENDAQLSPPLDDRNGRLDAGLLEYLTVHSSQPNVRSNGEARVNISGNNLQPLAALLQERFDSTRASEILARLAGRPVRSPLEFFARSEMSADEFKLVENDITATNATTLVGLVNVNTASEAVLACIPGIGTENAPSMISKRPADAAQEASITWVTGVLEGDSLVEAGPFLTGRSYRSSADIAAVGHHGRGYRRVVYVVDTTEGSPKIVARRDLSFAGWALGPTAREMLRLVREIK